MTSATVLSVPPAGDVARRLAGRPSVLLLDIDGTLAPIAPRPSEARIPESARRILVALAKRPGVHVGVVSGRGAEDARALASVPAAWIIGNHGIERAAPMGPVVVREDVRRFEDAMARAAGRLESFAATHHGVVVENKRWTLAVHYRLASRGDVPVVRRTTTAIAEELGLRVSEGKEVVEIRPPVAIDKGIACVELATALGAASVLYAGDDRTDEDAFAALRLRFPAAVTVRIGDASAPTDAEFCLEAPSQLEQLLGWMLREPG